VLAIAALLVDRAVDAATRSLGGLRVAASGAGARAAQLM
jgi:hypothetical protein